MLVEDGIEGEGLPFHDVFIDLQISGRCGDCGELIEGNPFEGAFVAEGGGDFIDACPVDGAPPIVIDGGGFGELAAVPEIGEYEAGFFAEFAESSLVGTFVGLQFSADGDVIPDVGSFDAFQKQERILMPEDDHSDGPFVATGKRCRHGGYVLPEGRGLSCFRKKGWTTPFLCGEIALYLHPDLKC